MDGERRTARRDNRHTRSLDLLDPATCSRPARCRLTGRPRRRHRRTDGGCHSDRIRRVGLRPAGASEVRSAVEHHDRQRRLGDGGPGAGGGRGGCSGYFGQNPATSLPEAYGRTAPYVACGYTPQQLRSAYGVPDNLTGEGVTVAVVRPWREPTAAQDLATFGARHGEPLRAGQFTEILPADLDASCPNGIRAGNNAVNVEEIPDIEAVHAMAPDAGIDYLGARCDDDLGTLSGLDALTEVTDRRLASVVSNSWVPTPYSPGLSAAFEQVWEQGAVEGIGFYFGSGLNFFGSFTARFPAADPWVTAVGGTTLAIGPSGSYEWETGWGDAAASLTADGTGWMNLPGRFVLGSGGGASSTFGQPAYQRGVVPATLSHVSGSATPRRVIPDIAADADFATPVLSGATESIGGHPARYTEFPSGGAISIALIAGMQADAEQAAGTPIGFANPAIYARFGSSAYHDVTDDPLGPGVRLDAAVPAGAQLPNVAPTPALLTFGLDRGLAATPGYDLVTGVGTPTSAYFASYRRQSTADCARAVVMTCRSRG